MLMKKRHEEALHLHVVGGAVAGGQVLPLPAHRVPDLQVVGLDGAASIVGRAVPREREGGPAHV